MALDPLDDSLIARTGGPNLAPAYGDLAGDVRDASIPPPPLDAYGERRPQFDVLEYAIPASASVTVRDLGYQPDWWYVKLANTANATLKIYRGDIASGPAVNLDAGTGVLLPAKLWRTLTLVAGAGATCTVNVYPLDAETALRFRHGS